MTYPTFVEIYNPTIIATARVSPAAVDDYLALGWQLVDPVAVTADPPLTVSVGDARYELLVARGAATAGQVPVLQADGTLAFGTVSGTGSTDPEVVRDTMATALVGGTYITFTPDDAGDIIVADYTGPTGALANVAASKTTSSALTVGQHNPVDAISGNLTMTLPTGQPGGKMIGVEKTDTSTNTVTISGNLRGVTTTTVLAYNRQTMLLLTKADGSWWPVAGRRSDSSLDDQIAAEVTAGINDETSPIQTALDGRYISLADATDLFAPHQDEIFTSADQSISSASPGGGATFTADTELVNGLEAYSSYIFNGELLYEAATGGDMKVQLGLPTGATASWRLAGMNTGATASPATTYFDLLSETGVGVTGGAGAGVGLAVDFKGVIDIGATPGDMTIKWAQNAANATPTIRKKNSRVNVRKTKTSIPPPPGLTPIPNATKVTFGGDTWTSQSPDKSYSQAYAGPTASPLYTKMELRKGDRWINDINKFPADNRQRVSLRGNRYWAFGTDIWFYFAWRVAVNAWRNDSTDHYNEWFTFYHNNDTGENGSFKKAEMNMSTRFDGSGNARLQVNTSGDPTGAALSTSAVTVTRADVSMTPYVGAWTHVLGKLRPTAGTNTGQAAMWLGQSSSALTNLFDLTGIPVGYNDLKGPYFKHGLYRTGSDFGAVVEFDNFQIGTTSLLSYATTPPALPTGITLPVAVDG